MRKLMIMAGGTGGHVMPALAVAQSLEKKGVEVFWMGSEGGLESKLVPEAGLELDLIKVKGLRHSGWLRKVMMPIMLTQACFQALIIILKRKPDALLGMGGFVSGPGGLVAGLLRKPLLIHEQNSVAGLTNKWLSRFASRVLTGFPKTKGIDETEWVGNPVRDAIVDIEPPEQRLSEREDSFHVLVLGGSQGAEIFNTQLPGLFFDAQIQHLEVHHQSGTGKSKSVKDAYQRCGIKAEVLEFIDDMANEYRWADVVVCRAGAMTVSEVCAAGVVAIFVPYPYAVNDHQSHNARYLVTKKAALKINQKRFIAGSWLTKLKELSEDRKKLIQMAISARKLSKTESTAEVVRHCEELINA